MSTYYDSSMTPDDASPETIARNMVNHTQFVTFQQSHEVARAYLQLRKDIAEYADAHMAYVDDPDPEHDYERVGDSRDVAHALRRMIGTPLSL